MSHNIITEAEIGIFLQWSDESFITSNTVTEIFQVGIVLEESHLNHIFLNDIAVQSYFEIYEWTGIHIGGNSFDNNITLNRIVSDAEGYPDSVTIRDDEVGLTNIIDRNFYDDYDGSGSYDIPGSAGNVDLNPILYPPFAPEWVQTPTNQVLDYWSQPFYYDLNASASSPITWYVNDTAKFTINSAGIIESTMNLEVGLYGLRIIVSNLYGVSISRDIQLKVQEITNPEWIVGPTDITLVFGEEFDLALIATDQSGLISWTLNDTSNFNVSVTHLNVTGYENGWDLLQISNNTVLVQGVYILNVSVSDTYGNVLSGILTITILPQQDTTPPSWIVMPLDETIEHTSPFMQRLGAWDESGIHHWWLNDSTHFAIDEDGVLQNNTLLEAGTYPLEVRAYDPFDNYCSATIVIIVLEPITSTITETTTTTVTTPGTTTTSGTTQNGFDSLALLILVGGISIAVIGLVIFVLYRKKN
jgi:hypothetical protein